MNIYCIGQVSKRILLVAKRTAQFPRRALVMRSGGIMACTREQIARHERGGGVTGAERAIGGAKTTSALTTAGQFGYLGSPINR